MSRSTTFEVESGEVEVEFEVVRSPSGDDPGDLANRASWDVKVVDTSPDEINQSRAERYVVEYLIRKSLRDGEV